MNLFDVYPLFDINIVKGKAATCGTRTVLSTSISTVDMLLSPSVMHIRITWR